jgi:epoxide hydrolase-like predicted phosphatase
MTIRAVIFDLGGVLASLGDPSIHRQWEKRLDLEEGSLFRVLWVNDVARQAMIGRATFDDLCAAWMERLSLPRHELDRLLDDIWTDEFDEELLAYIRSLRPTLKTAILSNATSDTREVVKEHINEETFDLILFSGEEGVRKPDPEIYRRALSQLGVAPEETIYVDDFVENVEAARALGIHAILFTDSQQVIGEIEGMLR